MIPWVMARLSLNVENVLHNIAILRKFTEKDNIELNLVTKFCCSHKEVLEPIVNSGMIKNISDSNAANFFRLPLKVVSSVKRNLIKTRLSDIEAFPSQDSRFRPTRFFVSDFPLLDAIQKISDTEKPEVILILEAGDLKEGFALETIPEVVKKYSDLNVVGVSANFACLSGQLPTKEIIQKLRETAVFVGKSYGKMPYLSVGGTVVFDLLRKGFLKGLVQEIRMGEGVFFAYDSSSGKTIPEFICNNFVLLGEILENRCKNIFDNKDTEGFTALGHKQATEVPQGLRKRCVLDFGILVAPLDTLCCKDATVIPVGQTFDFSVMDVTDSIEDYKVGDFIPFYVNYGGASQAMINPFVDFEVISAEKKD